MIAIQSESGTLLKILPWKSGEAVGYHPLYGFVTDHTFRERQSNRIRHGFDPGQEELSFAFHMHGHEASNFRLDEPRNCELELAQNQAWNVRVGPRLFVVRPAAHKEAIPPSTRTETKNRVLPISIMSVLLLALIAFLVLPKFETKSAEPQVVEQVTVHIAKPVVQKPVAVVPSIEKIPEVAKQAKVTKRAIAQDLGFLGLLGRKDLKKAIGGAPTQLKDASAGAGAGGKEGSGGELLVGLGQGLKRVTVGNTGVAGLGGIGTRGAGGGAGGYGNSAIGSGEGKALSAVPLSQELMLEGGLDRSVVQATIAKYLSQVRACYEEGLKRNPALGGQVTMAFEVAGSGNLNFAKVSKTSLGDSGVEKCISERMLSWKFPQPRGGVNVKVSYPFMLRSAKS